TNRGGSATADEDRLCCSRRKAGSGRSVRATDGTGFGCNDGALSSKGAISRERDKDRIISAPDAPIRALRMGIIWRTTSVLFRCDIPGCYGTHAEQPDPDWDDSRAAIPKARELGWSMSKERGRWKAFCPQCSTVNDGESEDVLRYLK